MYPDDPAQREHARQNILLQAYEAKLAELCGPSRWTTPEAHEFAMIVALSTLDEADKADADERKAALAAGSAKLIALLDDAADRLAKRDASHGLDDLGKRLRLLLSMLGKLAARGELGAGFILYRYGQLAEAVIAAYRTEHDNH